jgi:hypothetical protein
MYDSECLCFLFCSENVEKQLEQLKQNQQVQQKS